MDSKRHVLTLPCGSPWPGPRPVPGEEPREDPLPHPVAPTRTTAPAGGHGAPSRSSCRSRSTGSAAAAVCRLPAPTLAGVSRGAWAPIRGAFEGPARSGLGSHADSGGHGGLQGRPPADSTGGRPHLHPESSPAPPCKGVRLQLACTQVLLGGPSPWALAADLETWHAVIGAPESRAFLRRQGRLGNRAASVCASRAGGRAVPHAVGGRCSSRRRASRAGGEQHVTEQSRHGLAHA